MKILYNRDNPAHDVARRFHISMSSPVGETSRSRCARSAGACPPRALDCADDGEGQALALREGAAFFYRSAGDRPPRASSSSGGVLGPTDLRDVFFRSAGALGSHTRIRAGFPRERWSARAMARDRPSPYDERGFSAAAAQGGAPPYCIETGRSLLPGGSIEI